MKFASSSRMGTAVRGLLLAAGVGALAGIASAAFLVALYWATDTRSRLPWLLLGLPLTGALIGWIYARYGREVASGNNLLLDRIHEPEGADVPLRMAPLILLSTVATHLFGGSAGREGTAVQMGGTLGDFFAQRFGVDQGERRVLLMAGISAGFGAVFGTPLAGAIFGIEVPTRGQRQWEALLPCLVASFVGDFTCRGLGIDHHVYRSAASLMPSTESLLWVALSAIPFGLAAWLFCWLTHRLSLLGKGIPGASWSRPLLGGLVVIGLTWAVGDQTYNGLSLPLLEESFHVKLPLYAFLLKIVFTAVTLGAGFKGGEVTPLFVIGATLGNTFASLTGQNPALFASLGFVAVFAGAANTPLACLVMGMELFGFYLGVPLGMVCFGAYLLSGTRGIFDSQKGPEV